jgi:eukaryotic-like serine/threonine-protein kinase
VNKKLSANTTLSHYRIVSKIGAGGMGEVYLAVDTQLERQVALKVLLAEIADDEERVRRFVQEAKPPLRSSYHTPNLRCTLYAWSPVYTEVSRISFEPIGAKE